MSWPACLVSADAIIREADRLANFSQGLRLLTQNNVGYEVNGDSSGGPDDSDARESSPRDAELKMLESRLKFRVMTPGGTNPPLERDGIHSRCQIASHFKTLKSHEDFCTEHAPNTSRKPFRIETAFGHNSFGVRPGAETRDLVEYILSTDHLNWAGLAIAVRSPGMVDAALTAMESMNDLAERAVGLGGDRPNITYTASDDDLCPLLPPGSDRVWEEPIAGLEVTIRGRPSLERAELACGRWHGITPKQTIRQFRGEGELRVVAVEEKRCLVEWSEPFHDVLIGDCVRLDHPTDCWLQRKLV